MQIKNKLYSKKYVIGTILNVLWTPYIFGLHNLATIFAFLICILLNQYFLAIVVADITGIEKNSSLFPTWLCGALKLLILVLGFYIAMKTIPNMEHFLVLIYIFQLIILVLSTKRVVKKN